MTPRDVENELERDPFIPLRVHLVRGKTLEVPAQGVAWRMRIALLVFQTGRPGKPRIEGYDVIAPRNIERIEPIDGNGRRPKPR